MAWLLRHRLYAPAGAVSPV